MTAKTLKKFTRAEIKEHKNTDSSWIVIGNKVYDITAFLDEHPGGCEVLLEQAGSDGTEAFEDVGHSTDAREMKEQYLIGEIEENEKLMYSYDAKRSDETSSNKQVAQNSIFLEYGYPVVFFVFFGVLFYWILRAAF